jgi:hypothetical protein
MPRFARPAVPPLSALTSTASAPATFRVRLLSSAHATQAPATSTA